VTVPHISPPLARRIDRLAWRAHAFHRFAHHPLCDAYRNEVLRVGRRLRVCKGCAFLAAGMVVGVALGAYARPPLGWGAGALLLALVLGALSLRLRMPKIMGRLLPGAGLGMALWTGWPCALAVLLTVAIAGVLYRRRGVERSRCNTCSEREFSPCSGFAPIVRRERAFRRRVDRWLEVLPNGQVGHARNHGRRPPRL
jgi:hypothetical protein